MISSTCAAQKLMKPQWVGTQWIGTWSNRWKRLAFRQKVMVYCVPMLLLHMALELSHVDLSGTFGGSRGLDLLPTIALLIILVMYLYVTAWMCIPLGNDSCDNIAFDRTDSNK